MHVDHAGERRVGYVGVRAAPGDLVAFEDWRGTTTLEAGGSPFGEGDARRDGHAGERRRRPLPERHRNPPAGPRPAPESDVRRLADRARGRARGAAYAPGEAHAELDRRAAEARAVILKNIDHPFTHI